MAIKEATKLFEISCEYIEEIIAAKDEFLKWYEEVAKEAKSYLLSSPKWVLYITYASHIYFYNEMATVSNV